MGADGDRYVCMDCDASPLMRGHELPTRKLYTQAEMDKVLAELAEAVTALPQAVRAERKRWRDALDILASYSRTDGRREWVNVGVWLRPGEVVAHVDDPKVEQP